MLIDTCSKSIIVFEFTINQSYIAKNLCVKRQEKVNSCKGNCHLIKELQSDDQREQSLPSSASLKYETLAFSSDIIKYTFFKAPAERYFNHFLVKDIVDRSSDFFRPPSC
jgi:hypothetical protein